MSRNYAVRPRWHLWSRRFGQLVLVIAPLLLLWWTFRQVPFRQVWMTMKQLDWLQICVWLVINLGIVILMTGRWWLILRALGHPLPYLTLTRYRLASFAVSYFTPGPQFGGEPLQVYVLHQRHQISGTTGTASVSLDKLLELIANFSFLIFGIAIALAGTWLPERWRGMGLFFAIGLLVFPLGYLILMLTGRQPISWLVDRLSHRIAGNKLSKILQEVESEMSRFCVQHPRTVLAASMISLSVWVCMVFEYWLVIQFLGIKLPLPQTISALVAARLAFLTPLPGGLGALEASQTIALQTLGQPPSYGISIALLIRLRDLLFGIAGLLIVVSLLGWQHSIHFWKSKDV
jgi:uncharacterized protein (TIRG00374 family)